MLRNPLLRIALGALLLIPAACSTSPPTAAPDNEAPVEAAPVLDGTEKSIVVVGYSTSYAWPDILQEMLDEHAGGERVYHVLNAVQGGAPVSHWTADPGTRDYERTVTAMLRDFFDPEAELRGAAPQPTVAICQQSLQLMEGAPRGPVTTEYDMVGAERGADDMEKMAYRLNKLGLDEVYIAMHIYKFSVEPEVGNERIALARLIERGHDFIHAGPDVWETTRDEFPAAFTEDRLHPNELGNKLMAAGWYRSLAGDETKQEVLERMFARSYDIRAMMQAYIAWRRSTVEDF
jgi:hypothetical protein